MYLHCIPPFLKIEVKENYTKMSKTNRDKEKSKIASFCSFFYLKIHASDILKI